MGKIADALGKYAQERKDARVPGLTKVDLEVLLNYNRETGHLINYDSQTGQVGNQSMEVLRSRGIIQRLLDNKLIFPGGNLTPKGLELCQLKQQSRSEDESPEATDEQIETKPETPPDEPAETTIRSRQEATTPPEPDHMETSKIAGPGRKETPEPRQIAIKDIPPPKLYPEREQHSTLQQHSLNKLEIELPAETDGPAAPTRAVDKAPKKKKLQEEPATAGKDSKQEAKAERPGPKAAAAPVKKAARPIAAEPAPIFSFGTGLDKKAIDRNLITLQDPQSYEAEQFKILRTNLLFPVSDTAPQSILVTGAMPGDGKTFVSANLAISIALNINKHVLLIDCDLRKPDVHRIFGFNELPGLSDYLRGQKKLESLLVRTSVDKLSILPGGSVPSNPSELMSTERMSEMIDEVKNRYNDRLIVLDSPPPGLAAETAFLARNVDGVILVVKHGKTPREEVEELVEKMGTDKILGVVINHLDLLTSGRYGYKKYGRYGKRYER